MNNHYNLNSVQFNQDTEYPYIINITASFKIGLYNFKEKLGTLTHLNGKSKEYKNFQPLLNYFFKQDDGFNWDPSSVKAAKLYADKLIRQEKNNAKQFKAEQMKYANEYLTKLTNRDETIIEDLSKFADKEDQELMKAINDMFKGQLNNELIFDIFDEIKLVIIEIDMATPEERLINNKEINNEQFIKLIDKYNLNVPYSLTQLVKNRITSVKLDHVSTIGRMPGNAINELVSELYNTIESKLNESA